jgi:hypothetical protein
MKRYVQRFVLIIFIIFLGNKLFSQDAYHTHWYTIPYDQNYVDIFIYGSLLLKQFYGPPNYGETPEIDTIESYYVLQLYEPITFSKGLKKETVEEIQLIFNDSIRKESIINWGYIIEGKAFFAETGHHHTPVIIIVNRIVMNG